MCLLATDQVPSGAAAAALLGPCFHTLPALHLHPLIQIGGGRKATQARRQAAAEAVLATGGFDTSITNYQSLLAIAKQQGAVGTGARGACKVCGQTGHLTKMCRNAVAAGGYDEAGAAEGAIAGFVDAPLEKGAGIDDLDLSSDSSSDEERRRYVGAVAAGGGGVAAALGRSGWRLGAGDRCCTVGGCCWMCVSNSLTPRSTAPLSLTVTPCRKKRRKEKKEKRRKEKERKHKKEKRRKEKVRPTWVGGWGGQLGRVSPLGRAASSCCTTAGWHRAAGVQHGVC